MFNLTVSETAERLGVGRQRVYQLVNAGALEAERVGRMWLIDDESVRQRQERAPQAGRPKKGAAARSRTYTLMNRTHEVLTFRYDETTQAFSDAIEIMDSSRVPLSLSSPRGKKVSAAALQQWWRHRCIPGSREGMDAKLAELGYEFAHEIPFKSWGLSLSDQYWIRPCDADAVHWESVNYFDNDFVELPDGEWLSEVGLDSPDNTSEGQLSKKWLCEGGRRLLVKGGGVLNQEPYNEVVATELYRRLLAPSEYVPYRLVHHAGAVACASECFISSEEEYIPAYYVRKILRQANHHSDYQHYLECCAALGVENAAGALAKMIVCDDILANTDRHWRNFGLVRNVETLHYRIAPLFDSGSSLWCGVPETRLAAGDFSFSTKPFYEDANRQLRLVDDYSWFDVESLEGFVDEAVGILSENPPTASRAELVGQGVRHRIERIVRML